MGVMVMRGAKLLQVMRIEQELQHIREESLLHEDYFILSGFRINKPLLGKILANKNEMEYPKGFNEWRKEIIFRFGEGIKSYQDKRNKRKKNGH